MLGKMAGTPEISPEHSRNPRNMPRISQTSPEHNQNLINMLGIPETMNE
jgi:hypothetical protein